MQIKIKPVLVFILLVASSIGQSFDYIEALRQTQLFMEAQRSGPLPEDNRIDYRYDSALDDLIVGGYYDAGDHVKFGFPLAGLITQMSWGGITYFRGYELANQIGYLKSTIQWATDYVIAAHTGPNEFYAQVGDGHIDHNYWGRPEEMTMPRPAFKVDAENPGSDIAGETAAGLAAASQFFRMVGDDTKADEALQHARELFDFANQYRGLYTMSIPSQEFYNSSNYEDELTWAAAWLARVTGESTYLELAEGFYEEFQLTDRSRAQMSWNEKSPALQVLLWELTQDDKYLVAIDDHMDYMMYEAEYTPLGLLYINEWGTISTALYQAHVMLQAATLGHRTAEAEAFAESQLNYALGSTGQSYVIGFGDNYPLYSHHRAASCFDQPSPCDFENYEMTEPNPQILYGGLVGGPDINDQFNDARDDYVQNEVSINRQGGFQSVLAYMVEKYYL